MTDLRPGADLSRRAMLGAVARWSVPTVVTITLGAKALAAVSCPPCSQKTGTKCQACNVNKILNCQCEPCLGPPYCTGGAGPPAFGQSAAPRAPGSVPGPGDAGFSIPGGLGGGAGGYDARDYERLRTGALRGATSNDPLSRPLYRDPFGVDRTRGGLRSPFDQGGLYGRLRGDSISPGRRP